MSLRLIISILVLFTAVVLAYFDAGIVAHGISIAMAFPLMTKEFEGESNLPGVARAYIIKTRDIDVEAKPIDDPITAMDALQIIGSHTLATGKYFIKLYSTQGKGTLKYEAKGNRDFENFETTGILFYPCMENEAIALSSAFLGQDLLILIEENADRTDFKQVGTIKLPARIVPAGDWGTELNGEQGITFNIQAFHGKKPVYFYDGSILIAADVDENPQVS